MEKQYICEYCPNRFKNKNEAERHKYSLHLRLHSWCCSALTNFEKAFNMNEDKTFDVCGYCGDEYSNNPVDLVERQRHLEQIHKYQECNQSKKFFRADHFRQHLKHSHAGTSGKWTNLLENICMKDEPQPEILLKRLSSITNSSILEEDLSSGNNVGYRSNSLSSTSSSLENVNVNINVI